MGASMAASLADAGVADLVIANRTFDKARSVAPSRRRPGRALRRRGRRTRRRRRAAHLHRGRRRCCSPATRSPPSSSGATARPLAAGRHRRAPRHRPAGRRRCPASPSSTWTTSAPFADAGLAERRKEVEVVRAAPRRRARALPRRHLGPRGRPGHRRPAVRRRIGRGSPSSSGPQAAWPASTTTQLAAVDAVTQALVAKLLHQPTVALRDAAGTAKGERLVQALRDLFDIDARRVEAPGCHPAVAARAAGRPSTSARCSRPPTPASRSSWCR